jgi:Flp pilus assembly pilin Flp
MQSIKQFLQREQGAATVEYAVVLSMILMAAIVAIQVLGEHVGTMYGDIRSEMESHSP